MASGKSGKENAQRGNLIIIHTGGEDAKAVHLGQSDTAKSKDSSKEETKLPKTSIEFGSLKFEGDDAKKLCFFYNEEINKIVSYPKAELILPEKQEDDSHFISIKFPLSSKEQFQDENKRLKKLIDSLLQKKIECKNKECMKIAVESFKKEKSVSVLLQPDWEKRNILVFSKDEKRLSEAETFIKKILDEKDSSLQNSGTSSQVGHELMVNTNMPSEFGRQNSQENAYSNSTKQIASSRAGRKFETSDKQSSFNARPKSWEDEKDFAASQNTRAKGKKFEFYTKEGLKVKMYRAFITKLKVDAIVNAANEHLKNIGGVAQAISSIAGKALEDGCKDQISKRNIINVSENCVTVSGNLPCGFVIHAVGPNWHDYRDKRKCLDDLCETVVNILKTSQERKFKVVVMPPISSGIFSVPHTICAAMYLKGIINFSRECTVSHVEEFHIIDIKDDVLNSIQEIYQNWEKDISSIDPEKLLQGNTSYGSKSYQGAGLSQNPRKSQGTRSNNSKGSVSSNNWNEGVTNPYSSSPQTVLDSKMTYEKGNPYFIFNGNLKVLIYSENLLLLKNVDVIVSTENCTMSGTGGLAGALLKKAGDEYCKSHKALLGGQTRLIEGSVCITNAGKLKFRNIYHVVIQQFQNDTLPKSEELIIQGAAVKNVLEKANMAPWCKSDKKQNKKGGVSTIAMALFGSGQLTTPVYIERHCEKVFDAISDFAYNNSARNRLHLKEIHLVNLKQNITKIMIKVFQKKLQFKGSNKQATERPTGSYDAGKGGGNAHSSTGYGYNKFNPEKYIEIDKWRMKPEPRFREREINDYIEPVGKPENLGSSKTISGQKGNLKLINSDKTMSDSSYGPENKPNLLDVKGKMQCIACEKETDEGYSLACQHKICIICQPGYQNICPNATCNKDISASCDSVTSGAMSDLESSIMGDCVICMDDMVDPVRFKVCKHQFCRDCISEYFSTKAACPVCNTVYAVVYGTQPKSGTAKVYLDKKDSLPGYKGCDTFIIDYNFSDGIQEDCHPNPGIEYKGLRRQAYLPNNEEGHKVLNLLKQAFEQGLTFTIGRSRTTGEENVLTWNDIHHKTRREGGPEKFGYRDNDYLKRVTEELEAKGIYHKEME